MPARATAFASALALLAMTLTTPSARGGESRLRGAATAVSPPAEVRVQSEVNMLYVNASVTAPAPASACYAVLTDYERLPEFVPGMRSSRIVNQPGEMLKVEQIGIGGPAFLGITVRTILGLTLTPPAPGSEGRIDFGSYGGNLRQMYGSWVVREDSTGCRIDYRATLEPDFPVPALIGPFFMRRQVEGQLDAIAREIARRQNLPREPSMQVTPLQ